MAVRPEDCLVLIRGAGDLASGVAYRLHRCRFPVVLTEVALPLAVRRGVAFAQAIFDGQTTIQGVTAQHVDSIDAARLCLDRGLLPVLVDPRAACRDVLRPAVLVDGMMTKANTSTTIAHAPLVIGLGPGFVAGVDCHAVVETQRGHDLGRVLWSGSADADTGTPGPIDGHSSMRVLRSPTAGWLTPHHKIGDRVEQGAAVATVQDVPLLAPFTGVLRGLVHESVPVIAGMKVGDIDPRGEPTHCFTISDKARAIAGGVLEAILSSPRLRGEKPSSA